MNPEQHTQYQQKYTNFDQRFVHEIFLDQIEISHIEDQVRSAGEDKNHIKVLADQIERLGQQTPTTGHQLPDGSIKLYAGIHRYKAVSVIEDRSKQKQTLKVAMGFPEVDFKSRPERVLWQLNENTELASKNCDLDDYIQSLTGLIREDHVLGTNLADITPEDLRHYVRKNIPNLTDYHVRKIAIAILSKAIFNGQRKFKNYPNKAEAAKKFNEINTWGLEAHGSGDCSKGYAIYFAESTTAISQNALHGAWHTKRNNPLTQTLLVVYCGDVASKTRNLKEWRKKAFKVYEKENSHPLWTGKIFDGIVFLPQILMGEEKEPQNALLRPNFFFMPE
jgi:hypothetical protein